MTQLVGLDAREAFRENPRGIGLYCRHLMREFGAIPHPFRVLAYHERAAPPDLPPLPPCVEPRRVTMRGGRFHLWERLRMPLQMRRDRLAVYHGTYNTLPPRLTRLGAVPMVVSLHDVIVTWYPEDLDDPYVQHCRAVTARVVRQATRIITVSEWSKQDICNRFGAPADKVTIIWNGVHPLFLADPPAGAGAEAGRRFAAGRPYVFCIASPQQRKNTDGLLRALGILKRRGELAHALVLTGCTPASRPILAQWVAREGLEPDVHLHGYVGREDLVALYAGAVLTVYPSHAEGWGIPVVESLAMGTPVATSNTTAMPEAGGEFAAYFDPRDPEQMADVIRRALADAPGFASRRPAAIRRARSFTWRAAAEKTLALYSEIAASR